MLVLNISVSSFNFCDDYKELVLMILKVKRFAQFQNHGGSTDEFFLVTNPEASGSPPKRAPPPLLVSIPPPVISQGPVFAPSPVVSLSSVEKSESFNSNDVRELTVDDIEDFEDDEDEVEAVDFVRKPRRNTNDAADLMAKLPALATGKNFSSR